MVKTLNPVIYKFIRASSKFNFLANGEPDMIVQGSLDRFCYFIQRTCFFWKYWNATGKNIEISLIKTLYPEINNINKLPDIINYDTHKTQLENFQKLDYFDEFSNYKQKLRDLQSVESENRPVNIELKTFEKNPNFIYLTFDEMNSIMNETQESDTVTINQISHFYDQKELVNNELKQLIMQFDLDFINERKRILSYCKNNNLFNDIKTNWNIFWLDQKDNELFILDKGSISYKDVDGNTHNKIPNRIENTLTVRENLFPRNLPFCVTDLSALNPVNSETLFIYYFVLGTHKIKEHLSDLDPSNLAHFKLNNLVSNYTVYFNEGLSTGNVMTIQLKDDAILFVEHQGGRFKVNAAEYSGEKYKLQIHSGGTVLNIESRDYPAKRFYTLILENK